MCAAQDTTTWQGTTRHGPVSAGRSRPYGKACASTAAGPTGQEARGPRMQEGTWALGSGRGPRSSATSTCSTSSSSSMKAAPVAVAAATAAVAAVAAAAQRQGQGRWLCGGGVVCGWFRLLRGLRSCTDLFISLSLSAYVCLGFARAVGLCVRVSVCLSVSVCQSVCRSVCLSLGHLFDCLSVYLLVPVVSYDRKSACLPMCIEVSVCPPTRSTTFFFRRQGKGGMQAGNCVLYRVRTTLLVAC